MAQQLFCLMMLLVFSLPLQADGRPDSEKVPFLSSEETARSQASMEGKHYIIAFHADWCQPCLWVEGVTMTDPTVVSLLNQGYATVKADLDDPEGFQLFQRYAVTVLPTLIVFQADGKILERIEGVQSPVQMAEVLGKHNKRKINQQNANHYSAPSYTISKEELTMSQTVIQDAEHLTSSNHLSLENIVIPISGYTIQTGVYTMMDNVNYQRDLLSKVANSPVFVEEQYQAGTIIYKVMSGHFATKDEAAQWRAHLATLNIPGYIRALGQ